MITDHYERWLELAWFQKYGIAFGESRSEGMEVES